ncbi:MAG: MbcA/ParS/Xre antitoxin family protein [Hyphomicrobium sp.]|nr:MbcA/ParS/Xre antitoxin family protein [Hyphomicrobium sp.]
MSRTGQGTSITRLHFRDFSVWREAWDLSTDEQMKLLGSPPRSTFFKWKKEGGQLSNDTVERISHLLNIYKSLRILFTEQASADTWLKRANDAPMFAGKSAIDYLMTTGSLVDLYKVRTYLDAQRGGWDE